MQENHSPVVVPNVDSDTNKCVLVIDADLPLGLIANTAAVLSLTLGSKLPIIGVDLPDGSGSMHTGLTMLPVPILRSNAENLRAIREKAAATESLTLVDVTNAAQTTTNYQDYEAKLKGAQGEALVYLGIGLFGPKKAINKLTGNLPLLR